MTDFNYKVRIPADEEYDHLVDVTEGKDTIMHWLHMSSWVDGPEPAVKYPGLCVYRGYYSARYYHCYSADKRTTHIGFRPAFEPLNNNILPADIADGDVVTIGTLYMNGKPVRIPQNPARHGDIVDYIPKATLEFRLALDDPTYQVQAIKCGNVFICNCCLLKNISYNDIAANLNNNHAHSLEIKGNIDPSNFKVRIPTSKEYDRLMDIANDDDVAVHWSLMHSWANDPELNYMLPNCCALRGHTSSRGYYYISSSYRGVDVGFRPAFELLNNNVLPADIADGDVVTVGTLYMDGEPVRIPQEPTQNGDIKSYIFDTELKFRPALDDPAYQVHAIKCGDVFVCDRCLLKYISYNNITSNFKERFQQKENTKYKFYMYIGDWSGDGHGLSEKFMVSSNAPVEKVREAHFRIKDISGIDIEAVCSDCEDNIIDENTVKKLEDMGLHFGDDSDVITPEDMAHIWLLLLQKADPTLELEIVEDDVPTLHFYGFDEKKRHIGFVGYGLF